MNYEIKKAPTELLQGRGIKKYFPLGELKIGEMFETCASDRELIYRHIKRLKANDKEKQSWNFQIRKRPKQIIAIIRIK